MLTRYAHTPIDHFEPDSALDPETARRLKGVLEKIDYTAFASNRAVLGKTIKVVEEERFQQLAAAAAQARALWVATALKLAEHAKIPTPQAIDELAGLRAAYEEYAAAYEALRRMVERGYVKISGPKTIAGAEKSVENTKGLDADRAAKTAQANADKPSANPAKK